MVGSHDSACWHWGQEEASRVHVASSGLVALEIRHDTLMLVKTETLYCTPQLVVQLRGTAAIGCGRWCVCHSVTHSTQVERLSWPQA